MSDTEVRSTYQEIGGKYVYVSKAIPDVTVPKVLQYLETQEAEQPGWINSMARSSAPVPSEKKFQFVSDPHKYFILKKAGSEVAVIVDRE